MIIMIQIIFIISWVKIYCYINSCHFSIFVNLCSHSEMPKSDLFSLHASFYFPFHFYAIDKNGCKIHWLEMRWKPSIVSCALPLFKECILGTSVLILIRNATDLRDYWFSYSLREKNVNFAHTFEWTRLQKIVHIFSKYPMRIFCYTEVHFNDC